MIHYLLPLAPPVHSSNYIYCVQNQVILLMLLSLKAVEYSSQLVCQLHISNKFDNNCKLVINDWSLYM